MEPFSPIDRYIIDKIRERRSELGISQEALSFMVERSARYISQFESYSTGRRYNSYMINEIAKALKCSPKDFWPEKPL